MKKDYEIVYNREGYTKEYPYTVWQKGQPAVFKTKQEAKKYAEKNKSLKLVKTIGGKKRTFIQKDDYEFDEVGLKRKDFIEKRTKAFPTAEGWFHIKKPVKVNASKRARKYTRRKPRKR